MLISAKWIIIRQFQNKILLYGSFKLPFHWCTSVSPFYSSTLNWSWDGCLQTISYSISFESNLRQGNLILGEVSDSNNTGDQKADSLVIKNWIL